MLLSFPFTDLSGTKRRPAILVTDTRAVTGKDGHFIFIGTEAPPVGVVTIPVLPGSPEFISMGLKQTSFIYPWKITTYEVSLITRRIGMTPSTLMERITTELGSALGMP